MTITRWCMGMRRCVGITHEKRIKANRVTSRFLHGMLSVITAILGTAVVISGKASGTGTETGGDEETAIEAPAEPSINAAEAPGEIVTGIHKTTAVVMIEIGTGEIEIDGIVVETGTGVATEVEDTATIRGDDTLASIKVHSRYPAVAIIYSVYLLPTSTKFSSGQAGSALRRRARLPC
jgi:hypothetical protein